MGIKIITNFAERTTLQKALEEANLTELPKIWDKKTPFSTCIVKIKTVLGDLCYMGKYDENYPSNVKITKSFEAVSRRRSNYEEIYPLSYVTDKGIKTKGAMTNSVKVKPATPKVETKPTPETPSKVVTEEPKDTEAVNKDALNEGN